MTAMQNPTLILGEETPPVKNEPVRSSRLNSNRPLADVQVHAQRMFAESIEVLQTQAHAAAKRPRTHLNSDPRRRPKADQLCMVLYRKITIDTRTDSWSTKIYFVSESRRSADTAFALGGAFLQFHRSLFAELRVAFPLHLLDLGDEKVPGVLGAREVQGGLA